MKKLVSAAVVAAGMASGASAATIATLDYGNFAQNGTLTNLFSENIVSLSIDFVSDAGTPATPVWELPSPGPGLPGTPPATFSDFTADGLGAFVASWSGLNVSNGGTFGFTNLDFGGNDAGTTNETLIPDYLGDEFVTLTFANGQTVSSFFEAGESRSSGQLVFDDANLGTGPSPVPLPAGLPLLLVGLGSLGAMSRRKKTS